MTKQAGVKDAVADIDLPRRCVPVATWSLLGVTGLTYVASLFLPLSYADAVQIGAVADHPHLLGLLASLFLHVNGTHFLFNAAMLWLFGRDVEERLGSALFFATYLLIGIAAQLAQVGAIHLFLLSDEDLAVLGASGAVSGVMGAFAGFYPRARIVFGSPRPSPAGRQAGRSKGDARPGFYAAWVWGAWMAVQVGWMVWNAWGYPVQMGVWGHGAGFVMGLAAAALAARFGPEPRKGTPSREGAKGESPAPPPRKRSPGSSQLRELLDEAQRYEARGEIPAARGAVERALPLALKRRASEEAFGIYGWLAGRGWQKEIPPERRLELAGLLANTGRPERAIEVLQSLLLDPSPEVAASALLAAARIFAGPMKDPARAEEALRMIDEKYARTRAALLASMERQRLLSALKTDPCNDSRGGSGNV